MKITRGTCFFRFFFLLHIFIIVLILGFGDFLCVFFSYLVFVIRWCQWSWWFWNNCSCCYYGGFCPCSICQFTSFKLFLLLVFLLAMFVLALVVWMCLILQPLCFKKRAWKKWCLLSMLSTKRMCVCHE